MKTTETKTTKKKILPILAIVFTLVMLVCVMAISASANDLATPSVSIDKFNLVFDDNVYLKYAVKFDGVADEAITENNIGMLYFNAPQTDYTEENATYTSGVVGFTTIGGTKYYTFEYRHISAKQMTDYVYSVAYIDVDGTRYYSAPNKFSVLEYAYAKLGKTGVASDNKDFRAMLESMLEYGANAQKYFNYNTDRLANADYYLVEVIGGTLEDGFTKGLYNANETATLTAPEAESGYEFAGWKNSADEVVSTNNPASLTAFAKNDTYTATYKETVKYSGGLEFTSNGDGTCYVSGIGTCTDTVINIPPFSPNGDSVISIANDVFHNFHKLTSIAIPHTVTSIDSYAFVYSSALTSFTVDPNNEHFESIDGNLYTKDNKTLLKYSPGKTDSSFIIPEDVTKIDRYAFSFCNSLTNVVIPNGVTYIGERTFEGCVNLENIILPESLETIGYLAFSDCDSITNITIPKNVSNYDESFNSCDRLEEINVDTENEYFASIDGILYTSDKKTLLQYTNARTDGDFIIPDGVTTIGHNAFRDCTTLSNLTIPASVTEIKSVFYKCTNLQNFIVDENNEYFSSIDGNLYDKNATRLIKYALGKFSLTFDIPESVSMINEHAFAWAENLYGVIIHKNVTSIGVCAFTGSSSIGILVDENNPYYKSMNGNLYSKDGTTLIHYSLRNTTSTVYISDNVTTIAIGAFACNKNIKNVIIYNDIAIYSSSFYFCTNLETIVLPQKTSIGFNAFEGCDSLKSIYYAGSSKDSDQLFISTSGNRPLLMATIYYYSQSKPTTEGNFWHYVDGVPASWTGYVAPTYSEGLAFTSNGDETCYVSGIGSCTDTDIIIPSVSPIGDIVTSIGANTFYNCSNLTSITIPDSVTTIGNSAFYNCSELTSITIPDSVTYIGDYAFLRCDGLKNVNISDIAAWCNIHFNFTYDYSSNPLYYAENLYLNGNLITKLVIPYGVTSLPKYAFNNQSSITNVIMPSSITSIGWCAFRNCTGITNIVIPDNVTKIGFGAFANCTSLTSITIPDSVTSIDSGTFENCTSLTNINISNIAAWCNITFYDYYSHPLHCAEYLYLNNELITDLVIPDGIDSIPRLAFCGQSSITSVTIPNSVTYIGNQAFNDCSNITVIYYTGNEEEWDAISIGSSNECLTNATRYYYSETEPTTKGNFWYYDENGKVTVWLVYSEGLEFTSNYDGTCYVSGIGSCTDTDIVIPPISPDNDTVIGIGDYAFKNCTQTTSVIIPSSITTIGYYAFYQCTSLTSIVIPNSVTTIYNCAFDSCSGLVSAVIGDGVTSLGTWTFAYCSNLSSVSIGKSVTAIDYATFAFCSNLTSIVLPKNIMTIGQYAFFGCTNLTSIEFSKNVTSISHYAFLDCTSLSDVRYSGNEEEWNNIFIGTSNSCLTDATIHYNYV